MVMNVLSLFNGMSTGHTALDNVGIKVGKYYDGYKWRGFVFALLHLFRHNEFSLNQLLNKLKYQSRKLVDCTTKEQYIALLQEIYNFKQSKKINLLYID